MLKDITAPYRPIEALIYDRYIAPAVAEMADQMRDDLLGKLKEEGTLLDVGCGGAQMLTMLGELRPNLKLVGLDLSPGQVKRARSRLSRFGERAEVRLGSALGMPFENEEFDAVMSIASIKHWPKPEQGISECLRVLKPGGCLYIVEADRECKKSDAQAFVERWRIPAVIRPFAVAFFLRGVSGRSYNYHEYKAMMSNAGLAEWKIERIENSPGIRMEGIKSAK